MNWTQDPRTFTAWSIERAGSTQRITEASSIRITEQGNIRIIEHFDIKWLNESDPFTPWTKE